LELILLSSQPTNSKFPKIMCHTFFFMARSLEKPHEKRKKKLPYYSRA
jgi:hypothetical protein